MPCTCVAPAPHGRPASWRRRSRRRRGSGCRRARSGAPAVAITAAIDRGDLVGQRAAVGVAAARRSRRRASAAARRQSSAYAGSSRSRRRSARRRRRPACPAPTRNATDSAIIRRFSSRSTLTTFSRCRPQVLPTSVQTGAKQSASTRSAGIVGRARDVRAGASSRTRRPRRARSVSRASSSNSSSSLGLEPGNPASIRSIPSSSSRCATRSFSSRGQRHPLPLHAVAQGGVVELDPAHAGLRLAPSPRRATRVARVAAVQRVVEHALDLGRDRAGLAVADRVVVDLAHRARARRRCRS